ncbi:MAG TPA: hypothetical protein PLD84_04030 [Chitinophagales bacterium]|nr:hypothetical protein [Chitinophagales bacterium]
MRNLTILLVFLGLMAGISPAKSQSTEKTSSVDIYTASSGETIFSWGNVDAGADEVQNVVRFSPVFNYAQQVHFDFSNSVGFYTGLDIRNVGLITHTDKGGFEIKIKERSYGLGIPVVFKVGNMKKGVNLGIGGEAEFMFAWKRKIFVGDDTKTKDYEWFSDNVNIFNPSLLAEIKFYKGQYIRFKYYLDDFLKYNGGLTIPLLPAPDNTLPDYALSSQLMYISFGAVIARKELDHTPVEKAGAYSSNDGYFRSVKYDQADVSKANH